MAKASARCFLAQGRDSSLQGSQLDVDPSTGQFLLNDDGVPLGNGAEEIVHFTERVAVETTRRGTFLKADRGSSEITADGVAGDPQLSSNPFAPETLAGQFADPIHDLRFAASWCPPAWFAGGHLLHPFGPPACHAG